MIFDYCELEKNIGYSFKNIKLLDKALTHKSYAVERSIKYHNERLEFLGDSVIGLVVSEYLIKHFKDKNEGYLSKLKSHMVSSKNLYKWAEKINLEKYVKLSKSEKLSGVRGKHQIVSDAFEALIAAVYLDSGFESAKKIIEKFLKTNSVEPYIDSKSTLQEYAQKKHKTLPVYKIISQSGPDHAKHFMVAVFIGEEKLATGEGKNKKEAEQNAAYNALKKLNLLEER